MNRVFSPVSMSLSAFALVTLSFVSFACANEIVKPVKADPSKGETLYANGDAARGIVACVSCHGAAGNSTISVNPKLSGQHAEYTIKQLGDFASPARNNAVMSTFAKLMTAEDMKNVSAYLAKQKTTSGAAKNKDIVWTGQSIYRAGIAEKKVPACAGCHSPNGAGIPSQFPRIAGQHQDYTIAQFAAFRTGTRKNSPQMMTIAKRMSDDEIKAVADFVAGLK